ncbi:prenyltransferase [Amycolatopsis sp. NPDC059657]|uniref:prenyltransferase n=1 Tax=Amycolatopsis sp. NPDC059657 TaxID=3346899 RepID=UPI0036710F10
MGLDVAGLHAEAEAAYIWLAANQNADGSWFADYRETGPADRACDANFTAYIAVGLALHTRLHGETLAAQLWPTLERAIGFVRRLQRPTGEIAWRAGSNIALLTGNCSIHHALRHASALATALGRPRPAWDDTADRLRLAIGCPGLFEPKPHSMDWYYPVLGSVLPETALATDWDRFVVPGLGVRCVHDQPWVTGGETSELALTLATRGRLAEATTLLGQVERLRHADGSFWTGYQFEDRVLWPQERTTWTAGAYLLAQAAVTGNPAVHAVFGELRIG